MKNDWLQLLLQLKQAVCSSYHHRKWKEVDWKHFLLETGKRQDGSFCISKWNLRTTLVLFKLSQTAREKRKLFTSYLAGVGTAGAITNKMPSQNNQTVGDFFFLRWFCLRCVWRFFTFVVFLSNKERVKLSVFPLTRQQHCRQTGSTSSKKGLVR